MDKKQGSQECTGMENISLLAGNGGKDLHQNMRVYLYRDLLRFRTCSDSPAIIVNKASIPAYLPLSLQPGRVSSYIDEISEALYFLSFHASKVGCPECFSNLFSFWNPGRTGVRTMKDHVGDPEKLQKMRGLFSSGHNRWRKRFLESFGSQCRACGEGDGLELAHITPVEDFFYRYRKGRRLRYPGAKYLGVEYSYRGDNLVILCARCHDAQTMYWGIHTALEEPVMFLEKFHRRHKVLGLFEEIIEQRGWRSAEDLYQKKLF